ncbi:hypothetical protein [Leptolyngbya sp. PCC 6406]|uniref:hypothetical protein n=1 Tax=Leptolyngbya sp. PCC 6406 TaxID=1173264 RepID=UPI0002AC247C|nr:hypothetical protein [Leptolyngbya sp. PCC 6406]
MYLKEVDGNLRAYKTSIDMVLKLDGHDEFSVSARLAKELKSYPDFLNKNYWYLATGKYEDSAQIEWEISVCGIPIQVPIKGHVMFKNGSPVLA